MKAVRDCRTWWRQGVDVHDEFIWEVGYPLQLAEDDQDTNDCIKEQLWAEREGLA